MLSQVVVRPKYFTVLAFGPLREQGWRVVGADILRRRNINGLRARFAGGPLACSPAGQRGPCRDANIPVRSEVGNSARDSAPRSLL